MNEHEKTPITTTVDTKIEEIHNNANSDSSTSPVEQNKGHEIIPMHNPIYEISCIRASLGTKASPLSISSWIGTALTLDGRDKITKVIQYSSRFLGSYYENIAAKLGSDSSVTDSAATLRLIELCLFRAKRFRNLQNSLTKSRKAYRLGRSFIEIEKLQKIGFVHWVAWYLRQHLVKPHRPVPNKEIESEGDEKLESTISWHPDTKDSDTATDEDRATSKNENPKIKLPRKVSSNLGPSTTIIPSKRNEQLSNRFRQYPSLSRLVYRSLSSFIDEKHYGSGEPLPLWKVLSTSFKLLGLAGFWAGDNIAFLSSSGFLIDEGKKGRAKSASIFAARSYFFACVSGLYLNLREFMRHRNGPLREAIMNLNDCKLQIKAINNQGVDVAYEKHRKEQELERFESELERVKQKHASICVALLKVSRKIAFQG